ncbi:MAG: ester cyclase [Candidatus Bathyarchaeota archaeon]|nr:ester cyclase [Candidatus Bathyarchaeota archaeon]
MSTGKDKATKKKQATKKAPASAESKNIEHVKTFYRLLDTGKLDDIKALCNPKAKFFYESGDPVSFNERIPLIKMFYSSFPDYIHVIEDIFAAGDKVAVRFSYSGTFRKSFMGFDPNYMSFKYAGVHILQFKDGKVFVFWGVEDELGMMTQLGLELKSKN